MSGEPPGTGHVVEFVRRDESSYLVVGRIRTSNPATVEVGHSVTIPWNIRAAALASLLHQLAESGLLRGGESLGRRACRVAGQARAADGKRGQQDRAHAAPER